MTPLRAFREVVRSRFQFEITLRQSDAWGAKVKIYLFGFIPSMVLPERNAIKSLSVTGGGGLVEDLWRPVPRWRATVEERSFQAKDNTFLSAEVSHMKVLSMCAMSESSAHKGIPKRESDVLLYRYSSAILDSTKSTSFLIIALIAVSRSFQSDLEICWVRWAY